MYSEERWSEKAPEVKAPSELAKLLLDAAAYMRTHGLAKGSLVNTQGQVCIQGAMQAVLFGKPGWNMNDPRRAQQVIDACEAITDHLKLQVYNGNRWTTAVLWNNDSSTTMEDIVAGMESTARSL